MRLNQMIFGKNGAYEETDLKREISKRSTIAYAAFSEIAEARMPSQSQDVVPSQPKKQQVQSKQRKNRCPPAVSEVEKQLRTLAGYILCSTTSLNVHVCRVAVVQAFRRKGIARALMRAAFQAAAKERRCCSASLYVSMANEPAIALYKSAGFQENGVLFDYYRPGSHATKMAADYDSPGFQAFLHAPTPGYQGPI
ncbi:acyl-CoA N-acyltransferase [Dunaliella salina]|uniref:Acyl-CoA N-acyltransferase n=1 Tax=Dunaliella salina TaxID=3046 RepID=A0ABQ7H8X2_DUNSA|nr:acyl-CoA N-acyltransferase [Dunaliella salina]|eukprot:KAF5843307.1 acyl-CoA N-acyltransferase [Dunaliella salina]